VVLGRAVVGKACSIKVFARFSGLFRQKTYWCGGGFYNNNVGLYDLSNISVTFYSHENDGCFVGDGRVISGRVLQAG
jgi:hypothetical protein